MIYHGNAYNYICETPDVLRNIIYRKNEILKDALKILDKNFQCIYITGAGSSYNAAVGATDFMMQLIKKKVQAIRPEELVSHTQFLDRNSICIGISQQGTSLSVIKALDAVSAHTVSTIAMTGEYETEITKHGDATLYIECGIEDAGATTKGYTATLVTLMLLAMDYARTHKTCTEQKVLEMYNSLNSCISLLPEAIKTALKTYGEKKEDLLSSSDLFVVSDYDNRAVMLECELKFSETCRFPVRGRYAGDFMHGLYNAVDDHTIFLMFGKNENLLQLKNYYKKTNVVLYLDVPPALDKNFCKILYYVVETQIIFVLLSKDRGINLDIPRDPDFHKKMHSKIE